MATATKTDYYTVKNVRTEFGHDKAGYDCTLHRDGKKVADVCNDGWGGELEIIWMDFGSGQSKITVPNNYSDDDCEVHATTEEARFWQYCIALPKWDVNAEWNAEAGEKWLATDPPMAIDNMVNAIDDEKTLRKECRTKVVFTLHSKSGEFIMRGKNRATGREINVKPSAKFRGGISAFDALRNQYGDNLNEIINERFQK